jgi:hypothetical protein
MANTKQISSILDSEMEVWSRVWWRLLEEEFLGWFIWLKDHSGMVEGFVEEVKQGSINPTEDLAGRIRHRAL